MKGQSSEYMYNIKSGVLLGNFIFWNKNKSLPCEHLDNAILNALVGSLLWWSGE